MSSEQQAASGGEILNLNWRRTPDDNGSSAFRAGAAGWALDAHALFSLPSLPETRGKEFVAVD